MPSVLHEALLALFRNRPTLAPELLCEALGVVLPRYTEARAEDATLNQVAPAEYRADLVVLLLDGKPVYGIVVEAQLGIDLDKPFTWPAYGVFLRDRLRCPTCVLVVAPDRAVAAWAARPIEIGAGCTYSVLVLGPGAVPWVADLEVARRAPELAVLSALAHGKEERALEVALAALGAVVGLDEERATLYHDLVWTALGDAARRALEAMMSSGQYEYQSDFAKKYIAIGVAEGEARGEARATLRVLERRGVAVSEEQRSRLLSCTDLPTLEQWLDRALTAASTEEVLSGA